MSHIDHFIEHTGSLSMLNDFVMGKRILGREAKRERERHRQINRWADR